MCNAFFSELLQWRSPPVIPPMGQSCSKYISSFSASSNPNIPRCLHSTNLIKISHLTCNPYIFRYTFLTVFSPSKNFQKPKNVGQLDLQIVSTYRTFLLINWYLVLKQPSYSFLILAFLKSSPQVPLSQTTVSTSRIHILLP